MPQVETGPRQPASFGMALGSLPVATALVVALNGLYMLLVAFGNITDYGTNLAFVRHVLAMDTTNFGAEPGTNLDDDVMWRAITSETLQEIAYLAIIAWEVVSGTVLLVSLVFWISGGSTGYRMARSLSSVGLMMMVLLFFGGFIAIGGEWFQMWRSSAWNGLEPAFRNAMIALAGLVLVHLPSGHWYSKSTEVAADRPVDPTEH